METSIRNAAFAKSLAITYSEYFDGISPARQRASLRITEEGMLEITNVEKRTVTHWDLQKIRQVPDQADTGAAVFAPDNEGAARLIIREAEALRVILETDAPLPYLGRARGQVRNVLMTAALAAACFAGLLFFLIPYYAGRAAMALPVETEIAMGRSLITRVYTNQVGTCSSPEGDAALALMVDRLEREANLYLPLEVSVARHPAVNATATMGGQITIFQGLLQNAETPEQVAAVMAHEIGHVANRDVTRETFRSIGSFGLVGLLFGDAFGISAAAGLGSELLNSSYSRAAEEDADAYAHELLHAAQLPPEALAELFATMQEQRGADFDPGIQRLISSHPDLEARITAARLAGQEATRAAQPLLTDEQWSALQGICSGPGSSSPSGDASKG